MKSNNSSEPELVPRLMSKISQQALELTRLNSQINNVADFSYTNNQFKGHDYFTDSNDDRLGSPIDLDANIDINFEPSQQNSYLRSSKSSSVSSEAATKKRIEKELNLQIDALQRKLSATETKLAEQNKLKNKMQQELESKTREAKFLEKSCHDKDADLQHMRNQIELSNKSQSNQHISGSRHQRTRSGGSSPLSGSQSNESLKVQKYSNNLF
jgi:hypothetical protein